MMKIALYGPPVLAHKYFYIISRSENFLLSGIKADDDYPDYPDNLLEEPLTIFKNEDELMAGCDVIIFLSFRTANYFTLKKALKESKHIFLNPTTYVPSEILREIHKLGEEAGILYYLKHKSLERKLQNQVDKCCNGNAEFIDIYRYIPAGIEKNPVLLQKIISKEIMFTHSLNQHEIKKKYIKTVPYCSSSPYIINIRFEFSNSSSVNLTLNFYTENNARFTELYYGQNMLRINSDEEKIEIINCESNRYRSEKKDFKLRDEGRVSEEIEHFLEFLSEKKYPPEYKKSGLAVHQTIGSVVNEIADKSRVT